MRPVVIPVSLRNASASHPLTLFPWICSDTFWMHESTRAAGANAGVTVPAASKSAMAPDTAVSSTTFIVGPGGRRGGSTLSLYDDLQLGRGRGGRVSAPTFWW